MKVKRIITTIEVEDNNSTTSVELTKLILDEYYVPLVVTNISSMGTQLILINYIELYIIIIILLY